MRAPSDDEYVESEQREKHAEFVVGNLLFVLGQYPVPDTFATADMAVDSGTPSAPTSTDAAGGSIVKIVDFAFEPAALEIAVGDTVEWVNDDAFDHSIVADDGACLWLDGRAV